MTAEERRRMLAVGLSGAGKSTLVSLIGRLYERTSGRILIAGLRRGFDMPVGDKGAQLSGGQRQRLSIARAFLKDAPILILDEPTSSLDTVSEQAVLSALARLQHGRTTFVIAHRLSTVRGADRILVLDAGRIAAEGRHDELLQTSGLYRRLAAQLVDRAPDTAASVGQA